MSELAWRLVAELPQPPPDAGDATRRAEEILSRSEFQPDRSRSWLDRAIDWIFDRFPSFNLTASSGGSRLFSFIIVAVFIGLLIFILSRLRFRNKGEAEAESDDVEITVAKARRADEWLAEAERFEAAGDWKLALRARYRWLLAELFERGTLSDLAGRTAGEYRGEVNSVLPDGAGAFAAATDLFELVWYGNATTGSEDNARFRTYADRVLAAAEVKA